MKSINSVNRFFIFPWVFLLASINAYGYDYFGSDLASSLVTTPDQCASACTANGSCQAWSFVKPPLKHPTSAVCFLKKAIPVPSLNNVCSSNYVCLSGIKRTDGWCGESPNRFVQGSQILGQGQVLTCSSGKSCAPKTSTVCDGWWIFKTCSKIQTVDFFCQ
ncbi:MAG: PAN domain-containing protein [Candidatus Methylumidiphilus sp.]